MPLVSQGETKSATSSGMWWLWQNSEIRCKRTDDIFIHSGSSGSTDLFSFLGFVTLKRWLPLANCSAYCSSSFCNSVFVSDTSISNAWRGWFDGWRGIHVSLSLDWRGYLLLLHLSPRIPGDQQAELRVLVSSKPKYASFSDSEAGIHCCACKATLPIL